MKNPLILALWIGLMIMFLSLTVGQVSQSLRNKSIDRERYFGRYIAQDRIKSSGQRVEALLGAACIIVATFWGFDAVLTWWFKLWTGDSP